MDHVSGDRWDTLIKVCNKYLKEYETKLQKETTQNYMLKNNTTESKAYEQSLEWNKNGTRFKMFVEILCCKIRTCLNRWCRDTLFKGLRAIYNSSTRLEAAKRDDSKLHGDEQYYKEQNIIWTNPGMKHKHDKMNIYESPMFQRKIYTIRTRLNRLCWDTLLKDLGAIYNS